MTMNALQRATVQALAQTFVDFKRAWRIYTWAKRRWGADMSLAIVAAAGKQNGAAS